MWCGCNDGALCSVHADEMRRKNIHLLGELQRAEKWLSEKEEEADRMAMAAREQDAPKHFGYYVGQRDAFRVARAFVASDSTGTTPAQEAALKSDSSGAICKLPGCQPNTVHRAHPPLAVTGTPSDKPDCGGCGLGGCVACDERWRAGRDADRKRNAPQAPLDPAAAAAPAKEGK